MEVAAAAYGAPDRGAKSNGLCVGIEFESPKRSSSGDEVKLDDFSAPARAEHSHAPEVPVLADKINLLVAELLREFLNHDRSVRRGPSEPGPDMLQ